MAIQLVNNGLAAYFFLIAVCVALAGQFLSLRVISLSLVAAIAGGAYGAKASMSILGTESAAVAMASGVLAGMVTGGLGAAIDACFKRKAPMLALLASLGYLKVVQSVITLCTGGAVEVLAVRMPNPLPPGTLLSTPRWLFVGLIVVVVGAALQVVLLYRTALGASAVAIGDDIELASLFGVPARAVQVLLQSIGGCIAGLAGVLMAADTGLRPDLGLAIALKAFGVLIAARGRFHLLFVWAAVLVLLEQIVGFYWGGQLREATGLGFLVIALLVIGVPRVFHYERGNTVVSEGG